MRVTFRAWEPDQGRGENLRWRVLVSRDGDAALIGNWSSTLRNDASGQAWLLAPRYVLRAGRYIARLVVTSGRGSARRDRFFAIG
ncbi:MAG: hypothetical protein AB1416_06105 [Actinomycetota bacterium]